MVYMEFDWCFPQMVSGGLCPGRRDDVGPTPRLRLCHAKLLPMDANQDGEVCGGGVGGLWEGATNLIFLFFTAKQKSEEQIQYKLVIYVCVYTNTHACTCVYYKIHNDIIISTPTYNYA